MAKQEGEGFLSQIQESGAQDVMLEMLRLMVQAVLEEGMTRHVGAQCHERTPARQLVVLAESFDKDWKASIDNREQVILRAYGDFMACEIPKGVHEIVFTFEPRSLNEGKRISLAALLVTVLIFFLYASGLKKI